MSGGPLYGLGLVALLALGACAPLPGAPGGVQAGAQSVTLNGEAFAATIAAGQAAVIISKEGARSARGLSVSVKGETAALGEGSGRRAKAAADKACAAAGGRFNAQAIGRYAAPGLWVFDGACA